MCMYPDRHHPGKFVMRLQISAIVVLMVVGLLPPVSLGQDVSGNWTDDLISTTEIADGETDGEVNPAENPEDYVAKLRFYLIEEKIPEIIMDRLNDSQSFTEDMITVSDILSLSRLDKYDLDAARKLLNKYNLTTQEFFGVDSLEKWLDFVDTSFYSFHDYLRSRAPIDTKTFEALGINGRDLAYVLMFAPDETFNVLRNGSYTDANIDAALATISKNRNQFFEIVRDFFVREKLEKMHPLLFWRKLNLQKRQFLDLWTALELTTEDVYRVDKFRNILDKISNRLNHDTSIGTFPSPDHVLVHRKIYQQFCDEFSSGLIKILAVTASGVNFEIAKYDQHLTINLIQLDLNQSTEYYAPILRTKDKSKINNCTYLTASNDEEPFSLISEELEISERTRIATTTAKRTNETVFILGSPLVCDSNLHGLAASANETHIIFDRYYEGSFIDDDTPVNSGSNPTISAIALILCVLLHS